MATVTELEARRAARARQREFDAAVAAEMARRLADERERETSAHRETRFTPRLRVIK